MAAKRQDRLLERQRGAGTRQIKNLSFNLLLPGQENVAIQLPSSQKLGKSGRTPQAELIPKKSGRSRKTPQPELYPSPSTRRTPAPQELSQLQSRNDVPAAANKRKRGRPKTIPEADEGTTVNVGGKVARMKRKLNSLPTSKDLAEFPEDANGSGAPEVLVKNSQVTEPDTAVPPAENAKKRRKRRSIGQQSIRKSRSSQGKSPLESAAQPKKRGRKPKLPIQTESAHNLTPEPPEYSRITTPAVQDRELSIVPASIGPVVALREHVGATEKLGMKSKLGKRKRQPIEEPPLQPNILDVYTASAAETDQITAEPVRIQTKGSPKPKAKRKRKPRNQNTSGQLDQELQRTEPEQSGECMLENAEGPLGDAGGAENVKEARPSQKQPKPRKKKRKSIGQQSLRSKKRSGTSPTPKAPASATANAPRKSKSERDAPTVSRSAVVEPMRMPKPINEEASHTSDDAVLADNETPPIITQTKRKRGRPRKIDTATTSKPETTTQSTQSRAQDKTTKTSAPKPRKSPKNTIPITYYAPPSPTSPNALSITNSDLMTDPLSTPTRNLILPKGINTVDVLSQVCREIIHKASAQLDEKAEAEAEPTQRAAYKRKQKTVNIYGEELEAQLFQLTTALNENTALAARMRKQAAEERALKKKIEALEKERENVRVRTEEAVKGKKARELEMLLSDISGAAKRGWEMEARKKEVAGDGVD